MSNLYKKFLALVPNPPLLIGTVIGVDPAHVQLPDGAIIVARGEALVGQRVFVRDGAIEGESPTLPVEVMEI
jgi:hypothetical protein